MSLLYILSTYYSRTDFQIWHEYTQSLNILWINVDTYEQVSVNYDYENHNFLKFSNFHNLYILYKYLTNDIIIFMPIIKNKTIKLSIYDLDHIDSVWIIKIYDKFLLNNLQKDILCSILIRWWLFLTDNPYYRYTNYAKNGSIPYTNEIMMNLIDFREKLRNYIAKLKNVKQFKNLLI